MSLPPPIPTAPSTSPMTIQGLRHFFDYAMQYPKRLLDIATNLGCEPFELAKKDLSNLR